MACLSRFESFFAFLRIPSQTFPDMPPLLKERPHAKKRHSPLPHIPLPPPSIKGWVPLISREGGDDSVTVLPLISLPPPVSGPFKGPGYCLRRDSLVSCFQIFSDACLFFFQFS